MNNSLTVCVDANVVVRYVLFQDSTIKGLWETWDSDGVRLIAPTLIYYEVANTLHQYQKRGDLSTDIIRRVLDTTLALPITLIGDAELHQRAIEMAATYCLPAAYDAHYLALAKRLDVDLWTADARLVNALQPFQIEWVKLAVK